MSLSYTKSLLVDAESLAAVQSAADLPTEYSRSGLPTLSFRGVRLHSGVDPRAEAEALVDSIRDSLGEVIRKESRDEILCIVFGPGLGYVLKTIESVAAEMDIIARLRVLCVEADAEVARKALALRVWEPSDLNMSWLVSSSPDAIEACTKPGALPIKCTASYRLNRAIYDARRSSVSQRPMRILVPTPLYGGSLPLAFHCADAFRELGHQVEVLDLSSYYPLYAAAESTSRDKRHQKTLQGMLATFLAEIIAARAMDFHADLVWAVAQTPLTPAALEELRHEGIHSALWFVEDYSLFRYWRELAPHYDSVFTIQRGAFHEELRALGVKQVSYLPCAANPNVHLPRDLSTEESHRYGADLAFVGAGYLNRQTLFTRLQSLGLKIWGNDWPKDSAIASCVQEGGRRVSTEETASIFNATRINLNLHSSAHQQGINPYGDFVNPRTFEIAACGAFQLVDARSELPELFEEGREIAVFRTPEEMQGMIEFYRTHDDERQEIARQARKRVLKEHTYVHRMGAALSSLEAFWPRLAQRKRGPNYIASLKEAAAEDVELLDFLSAFPEDEEIDLDAIVSRITLGEGKLSRAEGIFLLMKEFRDWGREKGVIQ